MSRHKENMKVKSYVTPKVELLELKIADIITLSAPDELAGYDDTVTAPDSWFN